MSESLIESTICTRGYELDRDAKIPPRLFLCYMEHLRWESLGQKSVDLASLFSGGQHMVVVAQQLHRLQDVGMNVTLRGTMEPGHVGNTSLELVHAFHSAELGAVAPGTVIAVFLGVDGRPTPLPDTFREGASMGRPRQQLAPPPEQAAPRDAWSTRFCVRAGDLDLLRHVNHANYLGYFEDARVVAANQGVYGEGRGGGRLRRAALEYRQQAVLGDELEVFTWRLDEDGDALGFELRRVGDGTVLCRARTEVV